MPLSLSIQPQFTESVSEYVVFLSDSEFISVCKFYVLSDMAKCPQQGQFMKIVKYDKKIYL